MAFKIVAFVGLVAATQAGIVPSAPLGYGAASLGYAGAPYGHGLAYAAGPAITKTVVSDDYDPNPQYSYAYDIQDALTGDSKNHHESRSGDVVKGSYSLTDSDGTRRTVEYTADPVNGFNAVVHKEPLVAKVAKVAAPVAYAAPIAKFAAPLGYGASLGYGAAKYGYHG